MVRDKADNDKNNFEQLVSAIKESKKGSTLGVIAKVLTENIALDHAVDVNSRLFLSRMPSSRAPSWTRGATSGARRRAT